MAFPAARKGFLVGQETLDLFKNMKSYRWPGNSLFPFTLVRAEVGERVARYCKTVHHRQKAGLAFVQWWSLKVDGAFETTLRNSSTTRDDLLLEPVLQAEQEKEE